MFMGLQWKLSRPFILIFGKSVKHRCIIKEAADQTFALSWQFDLAVIENSWKVHSIKCTPSWHEKDVKKCSRPLINSFCSGTVGFTLPSHPVVAPLFTAFFMEKKIVIREMFYWTYWWPRFINDMNVKMYVEAWCYYKQNVDDRRPAHLLARRYFEPQKGIRPTTILWQRGCSKYCGYGDDSTCVEPTPQLSIWFQEAQWLELPTYDQKVERSNPRWGFKSSIFCKWARRTSTYRRQ